MANFTTLVALIGLFCFPATVIVRELRRTRSALGYVLLVTTMVSLVWGYFDSLPSSGTRYGVLSYAAVLALSAYLYFNPDQRNDRTSSINGSAVQSIIRDNARHLIIALALVVVALIYAHSHRFQGILDRSRDRVLILDRWTGDVKTKY